MRLQHTLLTTDRAARALPRASAASSSLTELCSVMGTSESDPGLRPPVLAPTTPNPPKEIQEPILRLRRHHVLHEDGPVAELVARDAVVVAELDRHHIGVVAAVPVNL